MIIRKIFDRRFDARTQKNLIAEDLKIPLDHLLSANQTHSKNIFSLRENDILPTGEIENIDAFISNVPGVFLMIKVADCHGILISDPAKNIIAAVHSGWRGSVQNIIAATIDVMKKFGSNPADLEVEISPSLGPCCQVFSDPYHELPAEFHQYIDEKNHVNFWQATLDQLSACGVLSKNIQQSKICTSCNTDQYFSYRKEGAATGRFAVVIGLNTLY